MIILAVLLAWSFLEASLWQQVVIGTASIATFLTSFTIIWAKFLNPIMAKPLAKALRKEFRDEIREVILEPETLAMFREIIEERFAYESSAIMDLIDQLKEQNKRESQSVNHQLAQVMRDIRELKENFGLQ